MFETSFFKPQKNLRRKALVAPISLVLHIALGLMIIVIPLLRPGELPKVEIRGVLLTPPPLPAPPPLPPGNRHGTGRHMARVKPVQAQPAVESGKLITPFEIPKDIAEEDLVDPYSFDGPIGSPEDGSTKGLPKGVVGDIIENILGREEAPVVVEKIKAPKLLKQVAPIYPEAARQARVQGFVTIEATTDVYGRVVAWTVLQSSNSLLDQAAADAVRQWTYEPMVINGRPRGVIFTVKVSFILSKN